MDTAVDRREMTVTVLTDADEMDRRGQIPVHFAEKVNRTCCCLGSERRKPD